MYLSFICVLDYVIVIHNLETSFVICAVQMLSEDSELTLLDFLQLPLFHFEFLRLRFNEMLSHLDVTSPDRARAQTIVTTFHEKITALTSLLCS